MDQRNFFPKFRDHTYDKSILDLDFVINIKKSADESINILRNWNNAKKQKIKNQ